jgi:hypothetical protein
VGKEWNRLNQQTGRNNISFADTQQLDGSGRLRVSMPLIQGSQKFEYTNHSHDMEEKIVGTASSTHLPLESSVLMSVPNVGDEIIRQTHEWFDYQPLNNQENAVTGVFGNHEPGILKERGYSNGVDGLEFRQHNDKYWIVLKSSSGGDVPTEQAIPQEEWNIDRFQLLTKDKSFNPSGKYIDFSKFNILHLDIIWLGGDRSRVAFKHDGIIYDAHEFLNAGKYTRVFMQTGSLPIRYRIKNESSTSGGSMKQICYTTRSEGGQDKFGIPQVAFILNRPVAQATVVNGVPNLLSFTPLLGLMPRQTFHGLPNRAKARMVSFELLIKGNVPAFWALLHDPVFGTNPTYSPVADETEYMPSMMSYATGTVALNPITNAGHVHNFGMATADVKGDTSGGGDVSTRILINRGTFDHLDDLAADRYFLAVAGDGGAIAEASAVLRWAEIF